MAGFRNGLLVSYGASLEEGLSSQIMKTELGVVLKNPIKRAESTDASRLNFSATESTEEVYKNMIEKSNETAVITDRLGRFDGLITRDAIEGWVMSQLLAQKLAGD
ncbi:hypothetical protein VSX64_25160 [Aurantimonas sp. C2-6-R+9]|uniref:hypothetical protein n=1 Tax=unclassified Aurantimonas TaxID=2638230 RepID=UPI002E19A797|nr:MULTISPECIES: hypothetical protein [unclassified Aurantimonas]MEC5293856.1 hypothetical protein [Aurantimonas sp. C2-3-R2]MEC5383981.1 hypothetical protein [Aurantimonas sp. C2-6-R+9]MEC5414913.1 hypothetical protein [Aurantimonas sp. C2-4-R8]